MKNANNRLGIFAFYDKDGIVDDYVIFLLNDLKKVLTDLVIVCNGKITDDSKKLLKNICKKVYYRPNVGYDVAAWKTAIIDYIGFEELHKYDEIVLFNNSFYGPFNSFKNIFEKMAKQDIDFWGITAYPESKNRINFIHNKAYIETYFIVFRKQLFLSEEFKLFWQNQSNKYKYQDIVKKFSSKLTPFFEKKGYKWSTYIDLCELFNSKESGTSLNIFMPYTLISKYQMPILLRKVFCYPLIDYYSQSMGEESKQAIDFIKNNYQYNVDMIYKNLIRVNNAGDLKRQLHLNYTLPIDYTAYKIDDKKKIAVIVHLYYLELLDETIKYLKNVPSFIDVYITTSSEVLKKEFLIKTKDFQNKVEVIMVKNRGRDISALLIGCKELIDKYDYLCFTHDKKSSKNLPLPIGKSFQYSIMENVLSTKEYILNIIQEFEKDPFLGILAPPNPIHASYFGTIGYEWIINYPIGVSVLDKLKIKANVSENKMPFILGTSFWFRTSCLKKIFEYNWKYTDFLNEPLPIDGSISHAIERIIPYVAQEAGYYSGWVMTTEYSSLEIQGLHSLLSAELSMQQRKPKNNVRYFPDEYFILNKKYTKLFIPGKKMVLFFQKYKNKIIRFIRRH